MPKKKRALIISAGTYRDKYFSALDKTTADAEGLAKVLNDAKHGAFYRYDPAD